MKKFLLLFSFIFCFICCDVNAQNCTVEITGGNCIPAQLSANADGGTLAKLSWFQSGINVFTADTISSPASISFAAGNNGSGGAANQLGFPAGGVSVDAAGNVYVADAANFRIQKWAPGATSGVTVAGGNGNGSAANQLALPRDVFVDAVGNIYVADAANHRIQKWAPGASSGVTVAGGNGSGSLAKQLNGPRGVYVDANGNVYIADTYNFRIQKWAPGATKGVTVAGGNGSGLNANQLYFPIDVYLDGAKNVYIADAFLDDASYHRVQKWAPGATSGVTVAGGNGVGSGANQFGYLLAIYVDAAGNIYAADNGIDGAPVSRVQKWAAGAQSGVTVAGGHGSGWDVLSYPTGVAADANGNIFVYNNPLNPAVKKYIPTNGITSATYWPTQQGTYNVQAILKNGCVASSNNLIVRAVPGVPEIQATQPKGRGNLCAGGIDTFYVNAWDDITTYKWTVPATCSLVSNLNDSVVIAVPAGFNSGYLIARGKNICGTGEQDAIHLWGRPIVPGMIKGPKKVNANQTGIVYSVTDVNSNHNWIVPADAVIQSGQGTASVTVNWGTTAGAVSVNSYNDCGASPQKEIQISLKNSFANNENVSGNVLNTASAYVFPNPAKNIATVVFNSDKQTTYSIELSDINGRILLQKQLLAKQGANSIRFNLDKYVNGTYIINIKNSETNHSLKLNKY